MCCAGDVSNPVRHGHAGGCCLGSEISWLLGRSGLAEGPASALSQESGTGHAAWGSHEDRESTGAVGWQPRQLSAAHPQHRLLWLKALAMCPLSAVGSFCTTHTPQAWLWASTHLAGQELQRFQDLLYPKTSDENDAVWGTPECWAGGAGQAMLPSREGAGGGLGLREHSGKRYRDGAILRLLPDHLLKPLSMIQ